MNSGDPVGELEKAISQLVPFDVFGEPSSVIPAKPTVNWEVFPPGDPAVGLALTVADRDSVPLGAVDRLAPRLSVGDTAGAGSLGAEAEGELSALGLEEGSSFARIIQVSRSLAKRLRAASLRPVVSAPSWLRRCPNDPPFHLKHEDRVNPPRRVLPRHLGEHAAITRSDTHRCHPIVTLSASQISPCGWRPLSMPSDSCATRRCSPSARAPEARGVPRGGSWLRRRGPSTGLSRTGRYAPPPSAAAPFPHP